MSIEPEGQFSVIADATSTDRDTYLFMPPYLVKRDAEDALRRACVKFTTMRRGTTELLTIDAKLDKPMGELLGKETFTSAVVEKMKRIHQDLLFSNVTEHEGVLVVRLTRPEVYKDGN